MFVETFQMGLVHYYTYLILPSQVGRYHAKSFFLRYIWKYSRWIPPRCLFFPHQFVLISLDNDQLSVILIATITASDIRSDSDGASIVLIISLPTSRSNARIRPFSTYCFMPSSPYFALRKYS